jgi:hypothetical protein
VLDEIPWPTLAAPAPPRAAPPSAPSADATVAAVSTLASAMRRNGAGAYCTIERMAVAETAAKLRRCIVACMWWKRTFKIIIEILRLWIQGFCCLGKWVDGFELNGGRELALYVFGDSAVTRG